MLGKQIVVKGLSQAVAVVALAAVVALWSPAVALATNVSGLIAADTTWTAAGSPWVLSADVELKNGATLAVEPGVVIVGAGRSIDVFGCLKAIGTSDKPVVFRSVAIRGRGMFIPPSPPEPSTLETFTITLERVDVDGGSLQGGDYSMYGSWTLRDSIVSNTTSPMHLWYPLADCYIENNVFINSGKIVADLHVADVYVTNNLFHRTIFTPEVTDSVLESWSVFSGHRTVARGNSFTNPGVLTATVPIGASSGAIEAASNYWGTTDATALAAMVFDRTDDLSSPGFVSVSDVLVAPDPLTPAGPMLDTVVTPSSAQIVSHSPIAITGVARDRRGATVRNVGVQVEKSLDNVKWTRLTTVSTNGQGRFSVKVNQVVRTFYRMRTVAVSPVYGQSAWTVVRVMPQVKLAITKLSTWHPARGKVFVVTGSLQPRHRKGTKSVVVYGYHYEGKRWVRRVKAYTVNADVKSGTRFSGRVRLNLRGRWRILAYHSDTLHAPSVSAYRSLTVK